jgi:hypothetical protein
MTPIYFELNGNEDGSLGADFTDGLRGQIKESGPQILDDWHRFHSICTADRYTREQFIAQLVGSGFDLVWLGVSKHDWLCIR